MILSDIEPEVQNEGSDEFDVEDTDTEYDIRNYVFGRTWDTFFLMKM